MGQTCTAPQERKRKHTPTATRSRKAVVREDERVQALGDVWMDVIGNSAIMPSPFYKEGIRMTYCDYVASGRGLQTIETFISKNILPFYANTHTEASVTGKTTNTLREESRSIIKRCCGAKDTTKCIFVGSGSTSAVQLIIGMLQLQPNRNELRRHKSLLSAQSQHCDDLLEVPGVVVLYGPFEHHSNILPWRELSDAHCEMIPANDDLSDIDFKGLETLLARHRQASLVIVTTSACSNVTGHISNVDEINRTIASSANSSNTLLFLDYACGAPYLPIDMHKCDAAFVSPHKFAGGPGTPGLLLVNMDGVIEQRYRHSRPTRVGGGTVDYVLKDIYKYTTDIEAREEGGTPDIVGSIRAGLCFLLKEKIGTDLIHEREQSYFKLAKSMWKDCGIKILGSQEADRVCVLSFSIASPVPGKMLHYNFVVALLNDLFGIQCRGGCMCAGPFSVRLLGVDMDPYVELSDSGDKLYPAVKPGYVRLSLNYFIPEWEARYILSAVRLVSQYGSNLMSSYTFSIDGSWVHKKASSPVLSVQDILTPCTKKPLQTQSPESVSNENLRRAERILVEAGRTNAASNSEWVPDFANKIEKPFDWFVTPADL